MYFIIERYMENLSVSQVKDFALKNDIILHDEEIDFVYSFVKKNWSNLLSNPNSLDLDKYKEKFSEENFIKIKKLILEYTTKYSTYL